jgi:hypothetical protein
MKHARLGVTLAATALAVAACDQAMDPVAVNDAEFAPAFAFTPFEIENYSGWVCKDGPANFTYDFSAEIDASQGPATFLAGVTVDPMDANKGTFSITGPGCLEIVHGESGGAVLVTELAEPAGTVFVESQRYQFQATNNAGGAVDQGIPDAVGSPTNSRSVLLKPIGNDFGQLALFVNDLEPFIPTEGRMTGGGAQIDVGVAKITRGFTIHCDLVLSNNLEINWADNKWHIDKPLTAATCIDDPNIDQSPPRAPFDTFIGEGIGELNGVDGSFVRFTFVDAGEPGINDSAAITIWAPGADPSVDPPYLAISGLLTHGNIQAHYDQPHGSNGNK